MRFLRFEIENFKGIRHAEIRFSKTKHARVYTLVGLNESGKTTLLEAIHSFSPDSDTEIVVGSATNADQQRQQRVPRSKLTDFSGDVSVKADIELDEGDREKLVEQFKNEGFKLDPKSIKDSFSYERYGRYKNGEFLGSYYETSLKILVKTGNQRKFRTLTSEESPVFSRIMSKLLPVIAYFPTFVFDFPEKIYLSSEDRTKTNNFYRKLFQDILHYARRGHTIEDHIIKRIRKPEYKLNWIGFLPVFTRSTEEDQIQQVMDIASQTVTEVIYNKWNEIFHENTKGKEIEITWTVEQGQDKRDEGGSKIEADEHDIVIGFRVKDGTDRFPIRTRSLGFRWFFSFLLFTQFRAGRDSDRPIVFLFDEPASNLHAAAQQKLIESFPEIAKEPHLLIYSTHSHYMVEPMWLEQAYIVQNQTAYSSEAVIDSAVVDDASVDIKITPYRQFVDKNTNNMSYFQPILDRLEVVPSKFDLNRGGVIVEGKSDYYILQYLRSNYLKKELNIFPAYGAGSMGAMIGLMKGWGLPVRIVLDSDKAGMKEKEKYQREYYLSGDEIKTLGELRPGIKEIESLFNDEDKSRISALLGKTTKASKKDILTAVQEHLAAKKKISLTTEFATKGKGLIAAIEAFTE